MSARAWRRPLAAFCLLALAALGARAADAPLSLSPCRLQGLEHDAMCGVLARPLDPAHPEGRKLDLHVAVLPALARQKRPDPVFFLAGGPGQSAIDLAGSIERIAGRLGARRDIVLVDQRGTGRSAPLACETPAPEEALARALDRSRLVAALDECRATLEKRPTGDLRFYTTTIAMADLDAVRAALGADRIDLVGVSYGTRAALEYLRGYPTHVRRVVLDAVAPPDMVLPASMGTDGAAALDALFRDCAAASDCAKAHPDLAGRWQRWLATLPMPVDVTDPVDGTQRRVTLTKEAAWGLVRPGLYVPALGAALPYAIEQASAGRVAPLMALGSAMGGSGARDIYEGMHFSVVCAEDAPRLPPAAANEDAFVGMYRDACAHWPRGEVPAAFYTVPASPAPVLLLAGAIDPVTPPRHARRMARALGAQARLVEIPDAGHGALTSIGCVRDAAVRWLDVDDDAERAKAADDAATCAAHLPRPPAFTPPLPHRAASAPADAPARAVTSSSRKDLP